MGCVYLAENAINKKCYIGKTIGTLEQRKCVHKVNSILYLPKTHFQRAINKYGFSNFEWEILYESVLDKNLIREEIYFINELKTKSPNGYNLTDGGDGLAGRKHTKKTKRKMSKAALGNKNAKGAIRSKEYLKKQSESHKGIYHTEETKKKMSKSRKGKKHVSNCQCPWCGRRKYSK